MPTFKALIIDDVPEARLTLRQDIEEHCPDLVVVGEAEGVASGIDAIKQKQPDVVFLDIEMGDGTGFDLLERIGEKSFQVIFTTGLDSYGIKAIKFSALDYLLKPVDPDELVKAVAKLTANKQGRGVEDSLNLLLENLKGKSAPKRIALHSIEKVHLISVDDIIRCESQGAYTIFYLRGGEQILATRNLKEFENMLEDQGFIRVHHSHLINFAYLKEYVKKDGGYAVMVDKSEVPVSTRKRNNLLDMMGG